MVFQEAQLEEGLPEEAVAPAFSFERLGGGTVSSAELKGQVVILDFWATWCGPCREEMPWLVKVAQEYQSKGVTFVAANIDDPDEQKAAVGIYVDSIPELKPFAVFGDAEDGARFQVRALPTTYVIDRKGMIVAAQTGQASERSVRRWLDKALEQK
jgi:cytochrome c biogenesis protein CcmG/thiol:disulfide interchange protein DsbE